MNEIDYFETDFVYGNIDDGEEIKSVHVKLNVDKDEFLLEIISEKSLTKSELEEIINHINKNLFKRIRISITSECRIVLKTPENKNLIKVEEGDIIVKKIIPMQEDK